MPRLRSGRTYSGVAVPGGPLRPQPGQGLPPANAPATPCSPETNVLSKKWPAGIQQPPISHIRNRAAICFRIAVRHALLNMPWFLNFLNLGHPYCQDQDCSLCAMVQLAFQYWNGPVLQHTSPNNKSDDLDDTYQRWVTLHAQAEHLIRQLDDEQIAQDPLDYLESLVMINSSPSSAPRIYPALWYNHGTPTTQNLLEQMFGVQLVTKRTNSCRCHINGDSTTSVALRIPMPTQDDVEDEREGDDDSEDDDSEDENPLDLKDLISETLSRKTNLSSWCSIHSGPDYRGSETTVIATAPLILPIAITRADDQGLVVTKPVSYPRYLKLNRFREHGMPATLDYELRAVICYQMRNGCSQEQEINPDPHIAMSSRGHHTVYFLNSEGDETYQSNFQARTFHGAPWRMFEPHAAYRGPPGQGQVGAQPGVGGIQQIQGAGGRDLNGHAYILFYSRTRGA